MNTEALEVKIEDRLKQAISEKVFPGAVVGVVFENGDRIILSAGRFTYESESPRMLNRTLFDIASLTKVLPTGLLVLRLIDEGKISLRDPITKFLPEITTESGKKATVRHLLTYSYLLKLDYPLSALRDKSVSEIMNILFTTETAFVPGTGFHYSNTSSILLGLIIERVLQKEFIIAAKEYVFDPLYMRHTTFTPDPRFINQIPPTEIDSWRGLVQGVVHDEVTFALQKSFFPGCAGVFSNASDILNFVQMYLQNGEFIHARILSPEMITQMTQNQLASIGYSHGLGVELNQPTFMGSSANEYTIGKTGFTGCVFVANRKRKRGFVLLCNRTFPQRSETVTAINLVRHDLADLVWSA